MNKLVSFLLLMMLFFYSCTNYANQVHINESEKLIVACDGGYVNRIEISGQDLHVIYEGVDTIYLNKPTKSSRITLYDKVDNNYILKLKPNSKYEIITQSHDHDQSAWRKIFITDKNSNILHDENNLKCF